MKNSGEKNIFVTIVKFLIFISLLLIQYIFLMNIYVLTYEMYMYYTYFFEFVKVIAVLYILYKPSNPAFKISWIILLTFIPVIGVVLYFLFGNMKIPKRVQKKVNVVQGKTSLLFEYNDVVENEIRNIDKRIYNNMKFLSNTSTFPIYRNTDVEYLELGEIYFTRMIEDMKLAKKYIFLEYFIIEDGIIFENIFKVLEDRIKNGVKVYILYDAFGSMFTISSSVKKRFKEVGIEFRAFNNLTPLITMYLNNRDHRKITVIDGVIGYSGGINIGDEYANIASKYGHWKDTGIRVCGDVVKSYAIMFLRMWSLLDKKLTDYSCFDLTKKIDSTNSDGYVITFSDGPYNDCNIGENIYIKTLNNAKDYVYITTPYLIITNEMSIALCNAALSGVDVRIIMPGIPDKKIVYVASRSFYEELLKAGVKIYEYTPGFIHSKSYISDDDVSIIGTINMDYRSLFLHYELGTYFYKSKMTLKMKEDYLNLLTKCREVKLVNWKKRNFITRVFEAILRAFSPML